MREAGYTALSISQLLGISVRSLQRHFATQGAKKGALKQELLDAARTELLNRIVCDDAIREEAARLINDDLAHARHIRGLMLAASEQLNATSLTEAVLVMRAAAAYSTALKNTSDTLRHTIRVERSVVAADAGLPELVIREMTDDDVAAARAVQASADAEM